MILYIFHLYVCVERENHYLLSFIPLVMGHPVLSRNMNHVNREDRNLLILLEISDFDRMKHARRDKTRIFCVAQLTFTCS